ncbi:energy-coupling factor transporter transmembrane component T [Staphylococcus caeli]|uniref:Cobalt ABC transporter permease n=1 Tax=Staphylococcus caeli TaxID=2201815 RepID=A0A1D4HLV3_9STAP|nr:energy-coupling factor transporter transmembrane component T [Staphylococcus caeli]SCS38126.1 cobalt ABC transporter permease [Staphylococcus caeli]SCS56361.1 cobalt ABC transporter permease [Staphylococcus caeli]
MRNQILAHNHIFNLDPRIKILMMLIVSLIALTGGTTGHEIVLRLIVMLIPALLLILAGKYSYGITCTGIITLAWYGEAFVVIEGQQQIATLLIFVPSGVITRFLPSLVMGYYIYTTTQVETLILGLERMKIPRKITIPIAVMFRFLPTIKAESSAIKDAMKMRGISLRLAFKKPMVYIEYRIVPLLNSVIKIGNELTVASVTRGLNLVYSRTSIIDLKIRWFDWLCAILIILLGTTYYIL